MTIAPRRLTHCLAAAAIAASLVAAPLGAAAATPPTTSATIDSVDATAAQSAGVVQISTVIDYGAGQAAGSGIVLSSNGIVVTNHHVVQGATEVEVIDPLSGQTYRADVLGYDAVTDVAVLRAPDAEGLTAATFTSDGVQPGEFVTAVGDAGGDGGSLSASSGVVLGTGEQITVSNEDGSTSDLHDLIAVDADIIPGDSGGALINDRGGVVGMNVAAGYEQRGAEITGYVIDIADVLSVVDNVVSNDTSTGVVVGSTGFLGVSMSRETWPVSTGSGVPVVGVLDGGPAAEAGIEAGDVITAIGSTAVADPESLSAAIAAHRAGQRVQVTWSDGVQQYQAEVQLVPGPVA